MNGSQQKSCSVNLAPHLFSSYFLSSNKESNDLLISFFFLVSCLILGVPKNQKGINTFCSFSRNVCVNECTSLCGHKLWMWPCAVGVVMRCGCGHALWVWPCAVGIIMCCGCGHVLWVWPCAVGVAISYECGYVLWVLSCAVGVAMCCGCGHVPWVWPFACACGDSAFSSLRLLSFGIWSSVPRLFWPQDASWRRSTFRMTDAGEGCVRGCPALSPAPVLVLCSSWWCLRSQ